MESIDERRKRSNESHHRGIHGLVSYRGYHWRRVHSLVDIMGRYFQSNHTLHKTSNIVDNRN